MSATGQADGSACRYGTLDLERYRRLTLCGQGAIGHVYKALDTRTSRIVALKIIRHPESWDRFAREVDALRTIDHPNVVRVLDAGCKDRHAILVMEYVDGPNLRTILASSRLSPDQSLRIIAAVLEGLVPVHRLGLVHRDIKPSNIMVTNLDTAQIKLIDFGVVKPVDPRKRITEVGTQVGTPTYMAPEQLIGLPIDASADIYAAGVMLWQMLTGLDPTKLALTQFTTKLRLWHSVLDSAGQWGSESWWNVVQQMLQPQPQYRIRDASRCIELLRASRGESSDAMMRRTFRETRKIAR